MTRDQYKKLDRLLRLDFNKKLNKSFNLARYLFATNAPRNGIVSLILGNCTNKRLDVIN